MRLRPIGSRVVHATEDRGEGTIKQAHLRFGGDAGKDVYAVEWDAEQGISRVHEGRELVWAGDRVPRPTPAAYVALGRAE